MKPQTSHLRDAQLAALVHDGDRTAFADLVRGSAPAVGDLLRRMGAQPALADDITQEAMISAYRNVQTFRGDATFATWVTTIAARLYLKRLRKDARTQVLAEPVDPQAAGSDEAAASHERLDLDAALAKLSRAERLCVSLCHGVGMTHDEIAGELGIPLGTVKSHVLRGIKKLRLLMTAGEGR